MEEGKEEEEAEDGEEEETVCAVGTQSLTVT